jgi:hypothetical protein
VANDELKAYDELNAYEALVACDALKAYEALNAGLVLVNVEPLIYDAVNDDVANGTVIVLPGMAMLADVSRIWFPVTSKPSAPLPPPPTAELDIAILLAV